MVNSTDAEVERYKAKVLSRWEGEGGALGVTGVRSNPQLDQTDLRILSRLGAALLDMWTTLPAQCRETLYQRAASLHAESDGARIKAEISRFLEMHKE